MGIAEVWNTLNDKQNILIGFGAKNNQRRYDPKDFFAPTHIKHYEDDKDTLVQLTTKGDPDRKRIVLTEKGKVLYYIKDQKLHPQQKKALKSFFLGQSDPYEFFQRALKQAYKNQIDNLKYSFDGLVTFPYNSVWIRNDSEEDINRICKQFSVVEEKTMTQNIKQFALKTDDSEVDITVGQYLDAVRDYRLSDYYDVAEILANKFDRTSKLFEYNSEHYKLGKISKYLVGSVVLKDNGDKTIYGNNEDVIVVDSEDNIVRIFTISPKQFKKQFSNSKPFEGKTDEQIKEYVLSLDETTDLPPEVLKGMADICFGKNLDSCGEHLCDLAETRKVFLSQQSEVVPTPTAVGETVVIETPLAESETTVVCPHCGQSPCACAEPTPNSEMKQFSVDGDTKAFKDGKALADAESDLTKSAIRAKFEEGGYAEEDWQNFIFGYMCVDKKAENFGEESVKQNSSITSELKTKNVRYFSKMQKTTKKLWV